MIEGAAQEMHRSSHQGSPEESLQAQLRAEGFSRIYEWQDPADTFYPEHTHPTETAHIILEGEMTLLLEGRQQTFGRGERCNVPAEAIHSARMGAQGCRYLVGER